MSTRASDELRSQPQAQASPTGDFMPVGVPQLIGRLLTVGSAYYFAARLGLLIPYVGTHVSLVWLPTGIAVAAYLRWGGLMSVAVFMAAVAANISIGGPIWMGFGIGVGNALGPGLSAWILKRSEFDSSFARRFDLGMYLVAVIFGMMVTATNGSLWLRLAGLLPASMFGSAWITWWIGDAVGALLGGVPLLTLTRASWRETFGGDQRAFNAALLGVVLLCSLLTFSSWPTSALLFPLMSIPLFVTAVLALRGGVLAASLSVLLLSGAAAWGTAQGVGPFVGKDPHAGLLALWSYIAAQACTSVLICGVVAELLASRRQHRTLFKHANEGILLIGPDRRIGAMNPRARAMLGLGEIAVSGRLLSELPLGNGAALLRWLEAATGASALQRYLQLVRSDGASLFVEAQSASHMDARGQLQTQLMLRDVTERRNAEDRLARSEQRLRLIADHMPALISHIDLDYRYTFANAHYGTWYTLDVDTPVGKTVAEVFGESVFEGVRAKMDAALAGNDVTFELSSPIKDTPKQLLVHYLPDRDAEGRVVGIYGMVLDRTEQHDAKVLVETSERQLRAVTDNLPVLISYLDTEERAQFLNATFHDWLGLDIDQAIGRPLAELVGQQLYEERREQLQCAMGGQRVEFDVESVALGIRRSLHTVYVPDIRPDGGISGIFTLSTDVTALKIIERDLAQLARADPLTGLPNRRQFDERLELAISRARRTHRPMAVIFIDIDHFKAINDTFGHAMGDGVLQEFAARLTSSIRVTDTAARLAGDEFVVILEELTTFEEAATIAAKLSDAIRYPMTFAGVSIPVTSSMGVAYRIDDGATAEDLMARADRALYKAKAAGRDTFEIDTAPPFGASTEGPSP